ncbi:MAG: peptide-methionine (S)-S-oxide reductase MsrA [Acidimicrobiales bacterium]
MLFRRESVMIDPADALPGRSEPVPVAPTHLVLGTPMTPPFPEGMEQLVVGMGCFWGAERFYWQTEGVYTTAAGYAGGYTPNPTYEETCTGRTGHTEAVLVVYDPEKVSIETLLAIFWENHDPTTANRQGNDVGTQYRSAIYSTTLEQAEAVQESVSQYQERLTASGFGEISTEVAPAGQFFYAEDHHQQYLHKNPGGYCNHGFCQVSFADS